MPWSSAVEVNGKGFMSVVLISSSVLASDLVRIPLARKSNEDSHSDLSSGKGLAVG